MPNKYEITTLGTARFPSPLAHASFVNEKRRVLLDAAPLGKPKGTPPSFELAGPRKRLFFDPKATRIGVVTCGGLCPGINDVIRGLVMVAWHRYGAKEILGFRYGYAGLIAGSSAIPMPLTPDIVDDIHKDGGTILGTSRGPQDHAKQVDFLVKKRINILFVIGGDGTQRGVLDISREIKRRKLPIAVVGVPKTIDNDIAYTERSFGFETAMSAAQVAIDGAHREAKAVRNGVGLVKLMGRESGFVAVRASLASSDVNLVLIPEVGFDESKLMAWLIERLRRKSHAVLVVAEGAGQKLVAAQGKDKSGNKKLGDIGIYLKEKIQTQETSDQRPMTVKYIDPSYIIRSQPANANDSAYCFRLAENAVHAAMAGRTALAVTRWNSHLVHVTSQLVTSKRKCVDPKGALWNSVMNNTGQPEL